MTFKPPAGYALNLAKAINDAGICLHACKRMQCKPLPSVYCIIKSLWTLALSLEVCAPMSLGIASDHNRMRALLSGTAQKHCTCLITKESFVERVYRNLPFLAVWPVRFALWDSKAVLSEHAACDLKQVAEAESTRDEAIRQGKLQQSLLHQVQTLHSAREQEVRSVCKHVSVYVCLYYICFRLCFKVNIAFT